MNEHFSINTQSKLFQKFMQTKTNKTQENSPKQNNITLPDDKNETSKQNHSLQMNKRERSMTETQQKCEKQIDQIWGIQKITDLSKNKQSERSGGQFNHKKRGTNFEGGVELNQILKRAIEKVRFSKIQDLITTKNNRETSQDDSLQKITTQKQQKVQPLHRNIGEAHNKRQQIWNQKERNVLKTQFDVQVSKVSEFQFSNKQTFKYAETQTQEVQLKRLQQQINMTHNQLSELQIKYESLINENKRLKFQINRQINKSQQIQKEKQQINTHARQLQTIITNKEKQIKKSNEDSNFWKNQFQLLKIESSANKNNVLLLQKKLETLQQDNNTLCKQLKEKEQACFDVSVELSKANEENKLAKQYLYQLTIKLYNYQQEIHYLKQNNPNFNEQSRFKFIQLNQKNILPDCKLNQIPLSEQQPLKPHQRKRQFSTERMLKKQQQHEAEIVLKQQETERVIGNQVKHTQQVLSTDIARSAKIAQIQQELSAINELKFINGKIRRRRIQLERQLQQIKPLM